MLALNVTIYGLGIVFLALLVLMFAIMVLTKVFSAVTGKEVFSVPAAGPKPEVMATSTATETAGPSPVAVYSSTVGASERKDPAASAPAAAASVVAAGSVFRMGIDGRQHHVEVRAGPAGATVVVVDGASFLIQPDAGDAKRVFVDGKPHAVEVKESYDGGVTVVVDGVAQKIDLRDSSATPVAVTVAPAFSAGAFKMLIGSAQYQVELKDVTEKGATVVVDGTSFQVERENARTVLVNGKPHAVEVRERSTDSAGVLVDGSQQMVQMIGAAAATSAKAPAPIPVPAPPVAPAPAPSRPAPAAVPAPSRPAPVVVGEKVTAPLPGKILSVAVKAGDVVNKGDELCVIEAMKMGNSIKAQRGGAIQEVLVSAGDSVSFGTPLLVIG